MLTASLDRDRQVLDNKVYAADQQVNNIQSRLLAKETGDDPLEINKELSEAEKAYTAAEKELADYDESKKQQRQKTPTENKETGEEQTAQATGVDPVKPTKRRFLSK
jgi:uncharacterized membrane protein YgaE (UPF0421/DUF939 family)